MTIASPFHFDLLKLTDYVQREPLAMGKNDEPIDEDSSSSDDKNSDDDSRIMTLNRKVSDVVGRHRSVDSTDDEGDVNYGVDSIPEADADDRDSDSSQSTIGQDGLGSSTDESEEEEDDDNVDLPLNERVQRREERGLSLGAVRARRSRALQVASGRLAELKQKKNLTSKSQSYDEAVDQSGQRKKKSKKKSKHAPTEVSSKRSDFFKRGARRLNESGLGVEIGANRFKPVDPRVSNLSGRLDEQHFEHNYAFLEEMRDKEISQLKKRISARTKVTGKKGNKLRRKLQTNTSTLEEDQQELQQLLSAKAELERNRLERSAKRSVNKRLREEVAQGKHGAYFLKKKERKRLELEAKFDEIRKRGGDKAVEKVLAKKRRKNKSRDAGMFAK